MVNMCLPITFFQTLDLFQHIVADAGYGSEENYVFIMDDLEKHL